MTTGEKSFPGEWKIWAHAAREGMEKKNEEKLESGREERKHWAAYWKFNVLAKHPDC